MKQGNILKILQSINQSNLESSKILSKSRLEAKRACTQTRRKNRKQLRPNDTRSSYLSVSKDPLSSPKEVPKGGSFQINLPNPSCSFQRSFWKKDNNVFCSVSQWSHPSSTATLQEEHNWGKWRTEEEFRGNTLKEIIPPPPTVEERVNIEMRCSGKEVIQSPKKKRKNTLDQESPQIDSDKPNGSKNLCKSRGSSPVKSEGLLASKNEIMNSSKQTSKIELISDCNESKNSLERDRTTHLKRMTKMISFNLSELEEQENKENESQEIPKLVTSQDNSPFKNASYMEERSKPSIKIKTEFDNFDSAEADLDTNGYVRNKLPRLKQSKSIERLNTPRSLKNNLIMTQNFKLIGAAFSKSLKTKVNRPMVRHRNHFLETFTKKRSGISLSLANTTQQPEQSSNKLFHRHLSPSLRKNFETFVEQNKKKRMKVTGTLKKILSNSVTSQHNQKSFKNLHSLMNLQSKITESEEDEEIKKRIKKNQHLLRFRREIREIYATKKELLDVSMPAYPQYLGYFFRKCYWDHSLDQQQEESTSCVSEMFQNDGEYKAFEKCPISVNKSEPDLRGRISWDLDVPLLPSLSKEWEKIHQDHLIESLQSYQYLNDLRTPEEAPKICKDDYITPIPGKKLLVFDMDETLIHCISDAEPGQKCDVKIPVNCFDEINYKHINLRPYVRECLKELTCCYQIIVFTASIQEYADPILDYLDKDKLDNGQGLIKKRYYRRHCYKTKDNCTIKGNFLPESLDLRIFEPMGYNLKDVILVDNATHCFGFQVTNGIPMVPFYDSSEDREMIHLLHYLQKISKAHDVRPILEKTFLLPKLRKNTILESIEGVIEQRVEEVDDDFFLENQIHTFEEDKTLSRGTSSSCGLEEHFSEGVGEGKINTLMRTLPKSPPLNSSIANLESKQSQSSATGDEMVNDEFEIVETIVIEC
ncbi:unnamed protein product [Moneuplotes crassus]|uniref:FCP1 homology domain-containing protein n=1 Tax=Euplotes crassus TaxID=5936 RepID=A0AAD1Y1A2_EUPCR|nr:unnamed protein product [Moneuplotes crassus]